MCLSHSFDSPLFIQLIYTLHISCGSQIQQSKLYQQILKQLKHKIQQQNLKAFYFSTEPFDKEIFVLNLKFIKPEIQKSPKYCKNHIK